MFDDIIVENGSWKFTGNKDLICACLSGKGCIQFPDKVNPFYPFVDVVSKDYTGKLCTRVWKFYPNKKDS